MSKEMFTILVVDDEPDYCNVLKMILSGKGYKVDTCGNGKEAVHKLEKRSFDLVVTDLCMPVMDGRRLLEEIKQREYDTEVIMLTAHGTIEQAVDAMKAGAWTYVTKGHDPEELLMEIRKIQDTRKMRMENAILKEKAGKTFMLESKNKKYRQMLDLAERAAQSDSNILILGESGAGQEVLKRACVRILILWSSTARHCPNPYWNPSCLAMKKAPLQERINGESASLKLLMEELCF